MRATEPARAPVGRCIESVEVWGRGRVSRGYKVTWSTQANAAHRRQCCMGKVLRMQAGCSKPILRFTLFIPARVWSPASRAPGTATAAAAVSAAAAPPVAAPAAAAPAAASPAACGAFQQRTGAAPLQLQAAFVDAGGPWLRQPVKRWLSVGKVCTRLCECKSFKPWPWFVRCKAIISSCRAVLCPNLLPAAPEDLAMIRMAFPLIGHLPYMWHLPAPAGPRELPPPSQTAAPLLQTAQHPPAPLLQQPCPLPQHRRLLQPLAAGAEGRG